MKKLLLSSLFLLSFIGSVNAATLSSDGLIIQKNDTQKTIFTEIESNKSLITNIWNQNTGIIGDKVNQVGCDTLNSVLKGKQVLTPKETLFLSIACYTFKYGKSESVITTPNKTNRVYNISKGLETTDKDVILVGETYSINNNVSTYDSYKQSEALFYKNNKVVAIKVSGGGLCGVSTAFYQAVIKNNTLGIVERWSHMDYYKNLYGNNLGLDATIYFGSKDFRFKNNGTQNIYVRTYHEIINGEYVYSVQLLEPFKVDRKYSVGKSYVNKSGKTCNTVTVGDKNYSSCYYHVH